MMSDIGNGVFDAAWLVAKHVVDQAI